MKSLYKITVENQTFGVDNSIAQNQLQKFVDETVKKMFSSNRAAAEINNKRNNFDFLEPEVIRAFFLQLVLTKNSKGEPFLTINDFETFFNRAFCGESHLPKVRFNARYGEYTQIVYLFYIFYTIAIELEPRGSRKNIKLKYQNLLTDNCLNYGSDVHVSLNFHKAPIISPWKIDVHDSLNVVKKKLSLLNT